MSTLDCNGTTKRFGSANLPGQSRSDCAKVGVYVCHCGHNIAGVVDVKRVAESAGKMLGAVHAETNMYTCSDTSLQHIQDTIKKKRLNRLVVASCSPRSK